MKIKIISCEIFKVYWKYLLKERTYEHTFDVTYLEIDRHNEPLSLKNDLQAEIDSTIGYDLIVLIYGICGNSTKGITARDIKVAIPRVHDCATILLGSKEKYKEVFGHRPSQGWKSVSYDKSDLHEVAIESNPVYQEYVEKYGEDNALYIFETLYPVSKNEVYVTLGMKEDLEKEKTLSKDTEIINGKLDYLDNILSLVFDDLLVLEEGEMAHPVYDMDQVMIKKESTKEK